MQGDARVIELLNEQLTSELTAINQYFLHAKMQENWGYNKLAAYTRKESIEEMTHAERLTDRILFLEGLPNYQRLLALRVGQTVREQFESDMAIEVEVVDRLRPWAARGSLLNFLGAAGPEEVGALWGDSDLDRLRAVKRAVDPEDVFRYGHRVG